ncbi:MAG: hypothetical protein WCK88_01495 [bacterium]
MSGELCISGEARVPLYRLAVNEPYPAKAEIDEIHFDTAFDNSDTIKLTDWYITEENNPKLLYKCSFLDNNQTQLSCLPGVKGVVNSETRTYILSAKVISITGISSLNLSRANVFYNGGQSDAYNYTVPVKIGYTPSSIICKPDAYFTVKRGRA